MFSYTLKETKNKDGQIDNIDRHIHTQYTDRQMKKKPKHRKGKRKNKKEK
jgi:hypothetical protein